MSGRSTEQSPYHGFQVSSINMYLLDCGRAKDIRLHQSNILAFVSSLNRCFGGRREMPSTVCAAVRQRVLEQEGNSGESM